MPILVDGDEDKAPMEKYGVRGYPTVYFLDSSGEKIGQMGSRDPNGFAATAAGILKKNPPKFTKAYVQLVRARAKMDKYLAKKDYSKVIDGIEDIEKVNHKGPDLAHAAKVKKEITEIARKQIEEAKAESTPKKAKRELKKIAKEFKGLEVADEAKAAADAIEE